MLEELRIRNLGVIEEAVLPLGPGLTVVTGETGAGKTMVVTGLLLLFGGRADPARVRAGAEQATVDGRVNLAVASAEVVQQRVRSAGGELDEDGTLVLRRVVTSGGRSRAHVGGAPAPVAVLSQLAERLLVVHGQADQIRFSKPSEQRGALDRFAGIDGGEYRTVFDDWQRAATRLADRIQRARELQREADLFRHGIDEIAAADPQPGEDTELAVLAERLAHADSLRIAAITAHHALLGDPDDLAQEQADAAALLGTARRALAHAEGADPVLDELAKRLDEVAALCSDLGHDLAEYADHLDTDPAQLAQVEARRAVLTGLVRKYGDDIDGVLAWAREAGQQLADLDVSEDALAELTAVRDRAVQEAARLAAQLSEQRGTAAERLQKAATLELRGLAMPDASLPVRVKERPVVSGAPVLVINGTKVGASADGVDEVEVLLQPHADSAALPLQRGASGGELSRVMLAVEVCLAGTDPVPTMVFDEVDAGVGGRAAVEVGRRLARLARSHQVIVVTHLAQVAAYADRHIVVDKTASGGGVTRSDVRLVERDDRIVELARMLGGRDTSAGREHAAELLATAEEEHAMQHGDATRKRQGRTTAGTNSSKRPL